MAKKPTNPKKKVTLLDPSQGKKAERRELKLGDSTFFYFRPLEIELQNIRSKYEERGGVIKPVNEIAFTNELMQFCVVDWKDVQGYNDKGKLVDVEFDPSLMELMPTHVKLALANAINGIYGGAEGN